MGDSVQLDLKYQQLLRDLKATVEGLVNSQVANVWNVYGGLNRLHVDVEKIFRNGCKLIRTSSDSDYWQFVQGLEWLQPDTSKSTVSLDCEYKPYIPQNIRNDRASIWLYRSLENHTLSQKLSWLLSDKTHLLACYQSQAFLCQESYSEATLICLRAVERNQPSLISELNPSLFLSIRSGEGFKNHRRCSSFPDSHLKNIKDKSKGSHSFDTAFSRCEEEPERKLIKAKLRAWNSAPNLGSKTSRIRTRSNTVAQSQTTPSTPKRLPKDVDFTTSLPKTISTDTKQRITKHILINNVVEHSPAITMSDTHEIREISGRIKSPLRGLGSSAPEFNFLNSLPISGEKDFKRKPKKSFIEDGGLSVLPMSTGYFPRPTKGQTLTSFLKSSHFSRPNAELDRENAHFSISEAVISAMEHIKCRKVAKLEQCREESDEEINHLKQRIRWRRRQKLKERQRRLIGSSSSGTASNVDATPSISSSTGTCSESISSEDVDDLEIDEVANLSDSRDLSMSMASLFSEADLLKRPRGVPDGASDVLSAEGVALSLISKFSEKQLPRASDLEWLVSEKDVPQALLPLPKSWPISPDDATSCSVTPLRGTTDWAPPRPQIIFTLHKMPSRTVLIEKQNYRCAGCGTRVAQQYAKKFRYCNYLGKYFCTGCHTNQLAIIPARVIQKWNFKTYEVSSFSYRLLEQMYADPLFRIFDLNKHIGKYSKNLLICKRYRAGLKYLKDYILTCKFAETIQDCLKSEPPYLLNDSDVYSIDDLVCIRTGEMKSRLKYMVELCCRHVSECKLCLAHGFICEKCKHPDVIFPWQMRTVSRCPKCGNCFHIQCWSYGSAPCARCDRISKRRDSSVSASETNNA